MAYTKRELLDKLSEIEADLGRFPTRRELRDYGIHEDPFYRVFGSLGAAQVAWLQDRSKETVVYESTTNKRSGGVDKLLEQLKNNLSEQELKAMVQATGTTSVRPKLKHTSHETGHFKMLVMGDTHIGHSKFREDWWYDMVERAERENVDFAYHTGDILEGMSGRPGHVYELSQIGFEAQFAKAKELIGSCPFEVRAITGNHDCLSEDTEVLTRRGWKSYTDLQVDDQILSYVAGTCVWDTINEVYVKEVDGPLIHVVSNQLDMLMTPNHRVLHKVRTHKGWGEMQYAPAQDLKGRFAVPVAALHNDRASTMSDAEIQLLAWILTDGACTDGHCEIYQSKSIDKILSILDQLKITNRMHTRHRQVTEVCGVALKNDPLPQRTFTFKYALPDKYPFPLETCLEFDDRQFEMFLQSLIDGDGSRYNNGRDNTFILYGTEEFLGFVQMLCVMHGWRANVAQDNRGTFRLNISKGTEGQVDVYNGNVQAVDYTGRVWCLSVPHTNFMARRNGKPFFTGNCWYAGKADQGIDVGRRLEEALGNFAFLGHDEADQVVENVKVKLWHGSDGGSYAISYRGQKIVESLDGGDKPHILLTGHDHKSVFFQTRNVHVIGAGTLCEQTSFMRGKKLAAHRGYWIVDVWSNEEGLVRIRPEWNPYY